MATASKLTQDYLTCIICYEVFTNPATLHCDHTFCRPCLLKYTRTQTEAIQAKSIPCPICKQKTRVTSPEQPVEDWVNQVKLSRIMQGLMEDFGPGVDNTDLSACSVCKEAGGETLATVWCSDCEAAFCDNCAQYHGRMPISRNHTVQELTLDVKLKPSKRFLCMVHEDEQVKLFCKDCKTAICHLCCSINHRTCKTVVIIKEILFQVTACLLTKKRHLDRQIKHKRSRIEKVDFRIKEISEETTRVSADITLAIDQATKLLMAKKKSLLNKLKEDQKEKVDLLKAEMKSDEMEKQVYQQQSQFIDQAMKTECQKDMFDIYKRYESEQDDVTDASETDIRAKFPDRVGFAWDITSLREAMVRVGIGEFYHFKVGDVGRKSSPVLLHTIDTKMKQDIDTPDISDVAVVDVSGTMIIVAVDAGNNRIKTFPTGDSQLRRNVLNLIEQPFGVTVVGECEVIVTLPGSKEMHKLLVYPNLERVSIIGTDRAYYGLALISPNRLAVCRFDTSSKVLQTTQKNATIDILDMKGNVLNIVSASSIMSPDFVCLTGDGTMLVSDRSSQSLIFIPRDHKVSQMYEPKENKAEHQPRGIAITSTGDILLVDMGADKVIQLTPSGEFVRNILTSADGLDKPYGICVDKKGLVYVSCKQYVKVFAFK